MSWIGCWYRSWVELAGVELGRRPVQSGPWRVSGAPCFGPSAAGPSASGPDQVGLPNERHATRHSPSQLWDFNVHTERVFPAKERTTSLGQPHQPAITLARCCSGGVGATRGAYTQSTMPPHFGPRLSGDVQLVHPRPKGYKSHFPCVQTLSVADTSSLARLQITATRATRQPSHNLGRCGEQSQWRAGEPTNRASRLSRCFRYYPGKCACHAA